MRRLQKVLGLATEPEMANALHALAHSGAIEFVELDAKDLARRRLRVCTDKGTECAIALPRPERLQNGSVLALTEDHAVVVRLCEQEWMTLEAIDSVSSLRLGFLAGHLHWRVEFDGTRLRVALDGPRDTYLARLAGPLADGAIRVIA